MKMNIVKQVDINATIDSKDMGVAFANATQEEQVDFIVAAVKEFVNSWHGLDTDTQMARMCDEILQSKHRQEIEDFINLMMCYYSYCKSVRRDKEKQIWAK